MFTPRKTFTLVELMIVVAIIAILAAIAIPALAYAQWSAKRAEVPTIVDGITTALAGFEQEKGYWGCDTIVTGPSGFIPTAAGGGGKLAIPWEPWCMPQIGFQPDGNVRGLYCASGTGQCYPQSGGPTWVVGVCDVDTDDNAMLFVFRREMNVAGSVLGGWVEAQACGNGTLTDWNTVPPGGTCY